MVSLEFYVCSPPYFLIIITLNMLFKHVNTEENNVETVYLHVK